MAAHAKRRASVQASRPSLSITDNAIDDRHPAVLLDDHHSHHDLHLPSFNAILKRTRRRMRSRQLVLLFGLLACAAITLWILHRPGSLGTFHINGDLAVPKPLIPPLSKSPGTKTLKEPESPPADVPVTTTTSHPISYLIQQAEQDFETLKAKQSKTLAEAVAEYRRRYGINPPPNFDKWYHFAVEKSVQLIDEYDTIFDSLTPFWGIKPATIRRRAKEALGYDNALIGLLIREGKAKKIDGGGEWQQNATLGMIEQFVKYLPDMDICFNIHDEPRVVVPHEDLSRLVSTAKTVNLPRAAAVETPRNKFSYRSTDINDGSRIEQYTITRFNKFAHQATWTHSRMSCDPMSPSRSLDEGPKDNVESYGLGDLGFIYNQTAFSDICQSPSFSESFGFFDRPNAFNVVHDLFPIFSQSKISSFQDILYPSPWYWYGKVSYDEEKDVEWQEKEDKMYWRGSTTGGFSRDGGWRRQHRQHIVQQMNAGDQAKILKNVGTDDDPKWTTKVVPRIDYRDSFDVKFSGVGQCDPGDCRAQLEFFEMAEPADQQDAWKSKYLVDIDGNAFSGRFYAFLKSKSLVYKMAIFREWHAEWLKPWVHYIPLSLRAEEWVESVRYFAGEDEGKIQAPRLAEAGRDWANHVLRNEDLEVWFFRLLLEYVLFPDPSLLLRVFN